MLVLTTSSLATRFNAVERPDLQRADGSAWNNDNVRRFLDAMCVKQLPRKVDAETGKAKGKIRYTEKAIRDAIPEFWEALLDEERRLATAKVIRAESAPVVTTHLEPAASSAP